MNKTACWQILTICIVTFLVGVFRVPLMDIDATQYASMSREMVAGGNYLQLYDLGKDYLDKPPMLFWLSALSLKIFGTHDWAYRLPSFLFSILAIYSTYRLALLFYAKEIAWLSALVLASCQAMFLMNHDVRTDTMLMGWVIASIWLLAAWYQDKSWKYLVLAAVCIAGGMMTKGPLALMIPVFAFVPHFLIKRSWRDLFHWQYIVLLIIISILLIPMSLGLYEQFDKYPGKLILGKPIDSGLRFYYWTQSFGRITGQNELRENGSLFFLLQNMLWSFLPWILLFILGFFAAVKNIVQQRFLLPGKEEAITLSGFLVTYLALGSSQVQLPHYIFVAFPFAAIITANFIYRLLYARKWIKLGRYLLIIHAVLFALLWIALLVLLALPFKQIPFYVPVLAGICCIGYIYLLTNKRLLVPKLLALCFFTTIGINIFLNSSVYPALLQYQTGNVAADYINKKQLPKERVFIFGDVVNARKAIYFYGDYLFKNVTNGAQLTKGDYVLISQPDLPKLTSMHRFNTLFTGQSFAVTKLSLKFLNPATRPGELVPFHIVRIE